MQLAQQPPPLVYLSRTEELIVCRCVCAVREEEIDSVLALALNHSVHPLGEKATCKTQVVHSAHKTISQATCQLA